MDDMLSYPGTRTYTARRSPEGSWEVHLAILESTGESASIVMRCMREDDAKEYVRLANIAWENPNANIRWSPYGSSDQRKSVAISRRSDSVPPTSSIPEIAMTTASRVSDSRVTDAAKTLISIVKRRSYSTLVYSPENIEAFTAACVLEAALACQGPVVKVIDIQSLIDAYNARAKRDPSRADWLAVRYELTALIAKANGHE